MGYAIKELEFILDNDLMNQEYVCLAARMRFRKLWSLCFKESLTGRFWE